MGLELIMGFSTVSTLPSIINKPKGNLRRSASRKHDLVKHYDASEYEEAESSGNKELSVYS